MKKDTLRVLVNWKCNLSCSYCCNNQERFRQQILPVHLHEIDFSKYETICISGGEPLLDIERVHDVCVRVPHGRLIVLYTNGIHLDRRAAQRLRWETVTAINVGLHIPETFDWIIRKSQDAVRDLGMSIRFQVQDIHRQEIEQQYPGISFHFWKMDDCDRENEDRVILID